MSDNATATITRADLDELSAVVGETLRERLSDLNAQAADIAERIRDLSAAWEARDFEWLADAGFLSSRTVAALREAEAAIDC